MVEKLFFLFLAITLFGIFGAIMMACEILWARFCEKWDGYARKKYNERHNKESMET